MRLGMLAKSRGNTKRAVAYLNEACSKHFEGKPVAALCMLGNLYLETKDNRNAYKVFKRVVE